MLLKVGSYVQSDETMIARDKRLTTMLRCEYVFMLLNYVFITSFYVAELHFHVLLN